MMVLAESATTLPKLLPPFLVVTLAVHSPRQLPGAKFSYRLRNGPAVILSIHNTQALLNIIPHADFQPLHVPRTVLPQEKTFDSGATVTTESKFLKQNFLFLNLLHCP